jgi:hypothetical protein
MRELVFLLEEESAKAMLEGLLPRILHQDIRLRYIPFEGKQDLERQMVRRLRGYVNPHARFIVLRDQDSAPDCRDVKARLVQLCQNAGRAATSLVRIACRELESFYLADLCAVEQALGVKKLVSQQGSAKFRSPDYLGSPSKELVTLTGGRYQKVSGSRAIGQLLDPDNERSLSFKNLIESIRRMESELLTLPNAEES